MTLKLFGFERWDEENEVLSKPNNLRVIGINKTKGPKPNR
jgi:hypothetical protein